MADYRKPRADQEVENLSTIVTWESQNHFELEVKRLELNDIEDHLAQKDLELATFQGELHAFEIKYLRVVGVYFAELDDIRAKIAEALVQQNLEDETLRAEAEWARRQAQESAEASEAAGSARDSISAPFKPSAEIKELFRDIAKRVHPDLGRDEEDRLRRHQFMAEANKAYRNGDESRLKAIIREWEENLESVSTDAITRLQQIIEKISLAKDQLQIVQQLIDQLRNSDMSKLKEQAEADEKNGDALFLKMSDYLQSEILVERERLRDILQRGSQP